MVESNIPTVSEQDVGGDRSADLRAFDQGGASGKTGELVIAMVAPIGSGATTTALMIKDIIGRIYSYEAEIIKISSLINDYIEQFDDGKKIADEDDDRIEKLQEAGNRARESVGISYLASLCIAKILQDRSEIVPRRRCTIIDALKHPEELSLLRSVYGDALWVVGVFAPEDIRINRLEFSGRNKTYLEKIKSTDTDEGHDYGQSVRKTMNFADVFIRNDAENTETLKSKVERFLRLIFGEPVETPTRHEAAMYHASGAGMRSACLSRQVGAVIVNEAGELIGQGANDVPKAGGGLYGTESGSADHRCFKWKSKQCWNDHHKEKLTAQIASSIDGAKVEVRNLKKNTDIKNLIEFSRAVHAEMEAIISVARQGGKGIVGATLYTTTFPCHNCARHIVASGMYRVIYIEPYPKSLALTLHSDAISTIDGDASKVRFLQYEGISPRSFDRVFGFNAERKFGGKMVHVNPTSAVPLSAVPYESLVQRENAVVDKITSHILKRHAVEDIDLPSEGKRAAS